VLRFQEDLKINPEAEENECCVICGRDYCESHARL